MEKVSVHTAALKFHLQLLFKLVLQHPRGKHYTVLNKPEKLSEVKKYATNDFNDVNSEYLFPYPVVALQCLCLVCFSSTEKCKSSNRTTQNFYPLWCVLAQRLKCKCTLFAFWLSLSLKSPESDCPTFSSPQSGCQMLCVAVPEVTSFETYVDVGEYGQCEHTRVDATPNY